MSNVVTVCYGNQHIALYIIQAKRDGSQEFVTFKKPPFMLSFSHHASFEGGVLCPNERLYDITKQDFLCMNKKGKPLCR